MVGSSILKLLSTQYLAIQSATDRMQNPPQTWTLSPSWYPPCDLRWHRVGCSKQLILQAKSKCFFWGFYFPLQSSRWPNMTTCILVMRNRRFLRAFCRLTTGWYRWRCIIITVSWACRLGQINDFEGDRGITRLGVHDRCFECLWRRFSA